MEKVYYWDACIYLAWLNEETTHGEECLRAISSIATENRERKNTVITSAITYCEVLGLIEEREKVFRGSFRSQDHTAYDVDSAIAIKARELRSHFIQNPEGNRKLATPDSIHLATAILYKADEFWTFDDGKKDKKSIGLLNLNRHPALGGLVVCKPYIAQPNLI